MGIEFGSFMRRWTDWGFRSKFAEKVRASLALRNAAGNLQWLIKQLLPGVIAIILVGMGQRCWLCIGASPTDGAGAAWTPLPPKVLGATKGLDSVPEVCLFFSSGLSSFTCLLSAHGHLFCPHFVSGFALFPTTFRSRDGGIEAHVIYTP